MIMLSESIRTALQMPYRQISGIIRGMLQDHGAPDHATISSGSKSWILTSTTT